jgi:imidazoleglycerol phosphate dehydratase HisB
MTDIEQHDSVEDFVGVNVGNGTHHAVALDRKGKRLLDSALPNDETKILLVVDQPARAGRHGSCR